MSGIIEIKNLNKKYKKGNYALKNINLEIKKGEIFALLGPNGAGKTTLINSVCGIVEIKKGSIKVDGFDVVSEYKKARSLIGLVPQEIYLDIFATVYQTLVVSRGLFARKRDDVLIERVLKDLSLWDKKDSKILTLSGGMKRRVLIAKALMNEPKILFLDEPTAGVDVDLRKDMWGVVSKLKKNKTTIILTTHYLEEAEKMADRVAIIKNGEINLVEEKDKLIDRMSKKEIVIFLKNKLKNIPKSLKKYNLSLREGNLIYSYYKNDNFDISLLFEDLKKEGVYFSDIKTKQSSLEDIFIDLVK